MRKIQFKNSGKVVEVENNVAHSFIDRGLAVLYKGFDEPPKDKMVTIKKNKVRKKEYAGNAR